MRARAARAPYDSVLHSYNLYSQIDPVGAANLLVSSSQDAADLATWRPFSDPHSAASAILASIAGLKHRDCYGVQCCTYSRLQDNSLQLSKSLQV
jgi:hypothetical protein